MTDRYKGFLVTLDKEMRDDDAEGVMNALRMVKNVQSVKPYVKGGEDYMAEAKARHDVLKEMADFIYGRLKE